MSGVDSSDPLIAEELRAALGDARFGNQLFVVAETGSTNDLAWEAESQSAPEGFVVLAERQTAGRGRYGRHWDSALGQGLWFSILLRPRLTMNESPQLTSLLARAIAATIIEETGCAVSIKMPNDIYLGDRKIAGVLVEGRNGGDGRYVAVAGLGINVNQLEESFPEQLRTTAGSLRMAIGHPLPRAPLFIALLRKLEDDYYSFTGAIGRNS